VFAVLAFGHAAGGHPCQTCHPREVAGYQRTAMAQSLSNVVQPKTGTFKHALSGTLFVVKPHGASASVSMTRDGLTVTYSLAYRIGSGSHAFGYLVQIDDHLFQAPISYYTKRKIWDMAPGYESDAAPDFFRPVTAGCLHCHAGNAHPLPDTLNQYAALQASDEAISCDRCHGDTSAHLKQPNRGNIVNPARLPERARDSVCEQCHLSGEVRILNPGKQFADFAPGQNLEDVLSVYVRENPSRAPNGSIKVISHAEQLALSACARNSGGKLWCGTCHDPHERPTDPVKYFRARCLSCHGETILQTHAHPTDNCIGCHMPKRPAKDGAHTAFTDHRIVRFPESIDQAAVPSEPIRLRAWREASGALATRNRGLANLAIGERDQSAELMDTGAKQLILAMKELPPDAVLLTKLGLALLRKGFASDAVDMLAYALKLQPNNAGYHANLGTAYRQAGQTAKAIEELRRAVELDPDLEPAYRELGEIYISQNDVPDLRRTLEQYLNAAPNNYSAIKALQELDLKSHQP
jgi:tetratricopeptide (TPR) repeat protein